MHRLSDAFRRNRDAVVVPMMLIADLDLPKTGLIHEMLRRDARQVGNERLRPALVPMIDAGPRAARVACPVVSRTCSSRLLPACRAYGSAPYIEIPGQRPSGSQNPIRGADCSAGVFPDTPGRCADVIVPVRSFWP
jgi:hypothetical protein